MACKQSIPAIVGHKPSSLGSRVRARSLATALTLGASVAFSAVTAVSSATAQELEWATSAGGAGALAVATDPRGNSYVTGAFQSTATFGAGEENETELTAGGSQNIFVAKYSDDGRLIWATGAGGRHVAPDPRADVAQGRAIATNSSGSIYVTGAFYDTATFGPGEENETELISAGRPPPGATSDIFVAKYDRHGRLLWAKQAGGSNADVGLGIATDGPGNSYVTGEFRDTAVFGAGEDNETELTAAGSDVFLAKYDRQGQLLWVKQAGGHDALADTGQGIATDASGDSYITGYFNDTATFGAGEDNETVLTSNGVTAAGTHDIFLAKYDRHGRLRWAKQAGGTGFELGFGVATDSRGNSYITGRFSGTAIFGVGEGNETALTAAGTHDIFLAKYDRHGRLRWAKQAGGSGPAEGLAIATDAPGNSYVTGHFSGTARFGAGEDNETELEAVGSEDVFVAKYARDGTFLWATSAGGASIDLGNGIAATPRGNSYVTGGFTGTATFGAGEVNETALTDGGAFIVKYGASGDQNQCPDSDQSPTVVLDGNDTGVDNVLTDIGCTILDLILQALEDAADRADFIRSVALLTRTLLTDGLITAEEAGIIRTAASLATFPPS